MIRSRLSLCAAAMIVAQAAFAFQYDTVTIAVSSTDSGYVARTLWDQQQYPLSEVHRSLERFLQYSTNVHIVLDIPDSLPAGDVAQLRNRIISVGFHQQRFYLRSETGRYYRIVIHPKKSDDLSAIVDSEIWEESMRHTLTGGELKQWLTRSLVLVSLPFWAGTQDTIFFWIVVGAEVIGLVIVVLCLFRRKTIRSNARWALPLTLCTGVFVLLVFNVALFLMRFEQMR